MKDLIVIAGAPGTGKTTISKLLAKDLNSFVFDFGILREVHLDEKWSNATKEEEQMSFENLIFILKNYKKHGYKNLILNDFQDFRVQRLPTDLAELDFIIFSLFVDNDEELKKRVKGPRDSGYKDVPSAIAWNRSLMERPAVKNEFKIDNSENDPNKALLEIIKLLDK